MQMRRFAYLTTLLVAMALATTASFAQEGKLKIKVTPPQAYVFVDGQAINHGSRSIALSAGKHTIVVVNYGYKISTQDVTIEAGKSTPLEVKLDAYGSTVSGPYGLVIIEGAPDSAVLSNGTTPGYFVGHVDEFNNDWIWHQNLLLPPGTHHLTVTRKGQTIWAGDVTVQANKKTIVDVPHTTNGFEREAPQRMVDWKRGEGWKDLPRFTAGMASTRVVVAPPTGTFSISPTQINCSQPATLTWQSADTVDANISGIGAVQTNGTQTVSPHATTPYDFSAVGPGGTVKSSSTLNVNTVVTASISANPSEVHYRKIGEKVITEDSTTVTWQTSNADSVTVDGQKVDLNGNETVKVDPADTTQVPDGQPARTVDENKTFTLNATNVCGGSSNQTANVHITGSVEPIPAVTLQSVFYPTDYPDKRHPQVGLVRSQQLTLATLAGGFKKYLEYDPDAKLSVESHADERGSKPFNQSLSERRVERIKQYLVDQGISADKVETAAYGKEKPLDRGAVKELESSNPNTPPKMRMRNVHGDWLAYNRRADIVLLPSGKKSAQYYPHNADDSSLIWQMPKPALKKVQADE
jgi:OmpA family/PEGA domain